MILITRLHAITVVDNDTLWNDYSKTVNLYTACSAALYSWFRDYYPDFYG